jgi:hypothetical protein
MYGSSTVSNTWVELEKSFNEYFPSLDEKKNKSIRHFHNIEIDKNYNLIQYHPNR